MLCLLNVAAVDIARKDYGHAIKLMDEACDLDDSNVKVLLRRAKAFLGAFVVVRGWTIVTVRP